MVHPTLKVAPAKAAATAAAAPFGFGACFIDGQAFALRLCCRYADNCSLRFLVRLQFDKPETFRRAGFAIRDHLSQTHGAARREELLENGASDALS